MLDIKNLTAHRERNSQLPCLLWNERPCIPKVFSNWTRDYLDIYDLRVFYYQCIILRKRVDIKNMIITKEYLMYTNNLIHNAKCSWHLVENNKLMNFFFLTGKAEWQILVSLNPCNTHTFTCMLGYWVYFYIAVNRQWRTSISIN